MAPPPSLEPEARRVLWPLTFDNPWIRAVDRAPRKAPAWAVLVVGAAACAVAILAGGPLGDRLAQTLAARSPRDWAAAVNDATFTGFVCAPLWLVALAGGGLEGRSVWRPGAPLAAGLGVGIVLGAGGFAAAAALAEAFGVLVSGAQAQPATPTGLLASFGIVAFQAGSEEILFRGWMQPVLATRLGPRVGLVLTALLFAGLHLVGGLRGPVSVINLILGGLMFGLLALRTGGLWAPFAAHLGWNWTELALLGLEPNPGVGHLGAVVDLDLSGPALLSGGAEGMNGSLAGAAVLGLIVLTLTLVRPRRAVPPPSAAPALRRTP